MGSARARGLDAASAPIGTGGAARSSPRSSRKKSQAAHGPLSGDSSPRGRGDPEGAEQGSQGALSGDGGDRGRAGAVRGVGGGGDRASRIGSRISVRDPALSPRRSRSPSRPARRRCSGAAARALTTARTAGKGPEPRGRSSGERSRLRSQSAVVARSSARAWHAARRAAARRADRAAGRRVVKRTSLRRCRDQPRCERGVPSRPPVRSATVIDFARGDRQTPRSRDRARSALRRRAIAQLALQQAAQSTVIATLTSADLRGAHAAGLAGNARPPHPRRLRTRFARAARLSGRASSILEARR